MNYRIPLSRLFQHMSQNWPEAHCTETDAILGLMRLHEVVSASTQKIISRFGLTPAAFDVLTILRALPPPRQLSPTELFSTILLTSGGMTKVLKQLEANSWIERVANVHDKRSRLVRITESGTYLIERAMQAAMQGDRNILSQSLSQKDMNRLAQSLLRSLDKLE